MAEITKNTTIGEALRINPNIAPVPTPNAPWVEIMAHNNDIRNPLFASAMVEWERRCGRLEGGQFASGRNARRGGICRLLRTISHFTYKMG